jgi:LPS-assembly lipoprotein
MYSSSHPIKGSQSFDLHVKGSGFPAYKFRRELEKQLAIVPRISDIPYRIDISVVETLTAAAYARDASATRAQAQLTAHYTVKQGNRTIATDQVYVTSSYPIIASDEFISKTAEKSAIVRTSINLAEDVAREIIRRLHRTEAPLKDTAPERPSLITDHEMSIFAPFDAGTPAATDPSDRLDLATPGY